jgi:hypothetical protein
MGLQADAHALQFAEGFAEATQLAVTIPGANVGAI